MKNNWLLIIILLPFFTACKKNDSVEPDSIVDIASDKETVKSIEEEFGITSKFFYTVLINGERTTYQVTKSSDYTPYVSKHWSSDSRSVDTGFWSHLEISISSEYKYYNIPDTSQIFYLNKSYSCSNGSDIPNDTLRFNLEYSINGINYSSNTCWELNKNSTLKITQLIPPTKRSTRGQYRCEIDSLFFNVDGEIVAMRDFIIQTKYY